MILCGFHGVCIKMVLSFMMAGRCLEWLTLWFYYVGFRELIVMCGYPDGFDDGYTDRPNVFVSGCFGLMWLHGGQNALIIVCVH